MFKYATRNACQFFVKYAYITRVETMFPLQSQTQNLYSSLLSYCTTFFQNFRFLALCPPEILTPKYHDKLKKLNFRLAISPLVVKSQTPNFWWIMPSYSSVTGIIFRFLSGPPPEIFSFEKCIFLKFPNFANFFNKRGSSLKVEI